MRIIWVTLILVTAVVAGCASSSQRGEPPGAQFVTATLPTTPAPTATRTLGPATPTPTTVPIPGTTSTQLNIRGEPSSASPPIGLIPANTQVQIRGKDPGGNWYQILFAQGKGGIGWVTSQYVNVKDTNAIPVVGNNAGSGSSGVITQQVFVRSGPGTSFDTLGTLNVRDVVALTARDSGGLWLQIEFAAAPDGKGWVAAGYVQANGLDQLPILGGSGELLGTATPTGIPPTAQAALSPAPQDHDSAEAPAVDVTFSPSGTGSIIYSSDLSAPDGDGEDWIRFTPYSTAVAASLTCAGNAQISTQLLSNGLTAGKADLVACGETTTLSVSPRQPYLLRLFMPPAQTGLEYMHYILRLDGTP